ncbi:MAG TPA: hypothetical protein VI299_16425 [Polyangiales bacterium]
MSWIGWWCSLLLLAVVVSQPLFYGLALGKATRQLSATSYLELRQQINAAIAKPLVRLYVVTLLALLATGALAFVEHAWPCALGAAVAALSLVVDLLLAVKLNVPINTQMDRWTPATLPSDWESYRARWDSALALRRLVLGAGFIALTVAPLLAHTSSY